MCIHHNTCIRIYNFHLHQPISPLHIEINGLQNGDWIDKSLKNHHVFTKEQVQSPHDLKIEENYVLLVMTLTFYTYFVDGMPPYFYFQLLLEVGQFWELCVYRYTFFHYWNKGGGTTWVLKVLGVAHDLKPRNGLWGARSLFHLRPRWWFFFNMMCFGPFKAPHTNDIIYFVVVLCW